MNVKTRVAFWLVYYALALPVAYLFFKIAIPTATPKWFLLLALPAPVLTVIMEVKKR